MGTLRYTRKELSAGVRVPICERTKIVLVPGVALGSLLGKAFEPGRSFILPRALSTLSTLYEFVVRLQPKQGVVVGHVNAVDAEPEKLGAARAESALAWLKGDASAWLRNYEQSVAEGKRWGQREDRLMLSAVLGKQSPAHSGVDALDPVERFQTLHRKELAVDGIIGPKTREKLIEEYFALSRSATLAGAASSEDSRLTLKAHSAAANVPLGKVDATRKAALESAESGSGTDESSSADGGADDADNARIDFVLFSTSSVEPSPGAADGPEFLEWVKQCELFLPLEVLAGSEARTQIALQLFDKTGRTRHAHAKYEVTGPEKLSGVTDRDGRLDHEDVLPGDYQLKLTLEFFADPEVYDAKDKIVDVYTSPVVVIAGTNEPQLRMLGAVPHCELVLLRGLLFETNKAFVMPHAIPDLRDVRDIYVANNPGELLVVGHTDTKGTPTTNDSLSLERAQATLAYLEDDVDVWMQFYSNSVQESRRWGSREDHYMLGALLGLTRPVDESQMRQFQVDNSIDERSVGEATRRSLIQKYMSLDGGELDSSEFSIVGIAHGCGENFPLDDSGGELDSARLDEKEDALDRRVELFFFDQEFGVVPRPKGNHSAKGSKEYPQWRQQAKLALERCAVGPTPPLELWLYNEERQLLPNAPYRVIFPDDSVSVGRSDENGMAVIHRVGSHRSLVIQWGQRELGEEVEAAEDSSTGEPAQTADDGERPPPADERTALSFYEFAATVTLTEPEDGLSAVLRNLGHLGDEVAQRKSFESFYRASDDALIDEVYRKGKSA